MSPDGGDCQAFVQRLAITKSHLQWPESIAGP
jgi:hypothetical protein